MSSGAYVALAAVVVALIGGAVWSLTNGRFRGTHAVRGATTPDSPPPSSVLEGSPWAAELGERATLLQFSSAFCAPCRATRRILDGVAAEVDGVSHVEVDAEHHLDVVRRLGILRTPTTLVLDAHGQEVGRASGAPTKAQVMEALAVTLR